MDIRFSFIQPIQPISDVRYTAAESAIQGLMKIGATRKEAMNHLIDASCELGLMPTAPQCVRYMLHHCGFSKVQHFAHDALTVAEIADYLASHGIDYALIVINHAGCHEGHMQYIRREGDQYHLLDSVYAPDAKVTDVWAYVGIVKETASRARRALAKNISDSKGYTFFNPNPQARNTGDCVPRAFSAVMGCTWKDALTMIAEASDYASTVLNAESVYRKALEKAHFVRHHRVTTADGHGMMPAEFLDYCNHHFTDGQPLFVHAGPTHAVGVVQRSDPDGVMRYMFTDSWNTVERGGKIGFFYVGPGRSSQRKLEQLNINVDDTEIIGKAIIHPVFGHGVITGSEEANGHMRLNVQFSAGNKTLSSRWVASHCKSAELSRAS